ncbi:MAG: hypothetical protein U0572_13690 [Phycisphaerales bacterium]
MTVRNAIVRPLLAVAASLAASGCVVYTPGPPAEPTTSASSPTLGAAPGATGAKPTTNATFSKVPDGKISVEQLGQLVQGFADRYYALISSAADVLSKDAATPEERLRIDRFQARTIGAVYDIATNPDPFSQLLDLTVVVTLTATVAIDEAQAEAWLGSEERAQVLKTPLRMAREEIWEIAQKALTPEQLETLDRLIFDWRRENPGVESVAFVRFDDFASSRGKSVIADVRTGTGLLAPIDEAKKEANEARLLGERMFYMAKRAPLLVNLESAHLLSQVAATPEVKKAVQVSDRIADSAERISLVAEKLPESIAKEREQLVKSIDQTSGAVRSTLDDYRESIAKTDELVDRVHTLSGSARELMVSVDATAKTLTTTLDAAERVAKQLAPAPGAEPAKPVDPEVYARIVADLKSTLVEVNKALESTRAIAADDAWKRPLDAARDAARTQIAGAGTELRGIVDVVFVRAIVLVAATFVLLFVYTGWSVRYRARTAHRQQA